MHLPLALGRNAARFKAALAFTIVLILMYAPVPSSTRCARASETKSATFDWGYNLRLRQEYLRNVFDLSNDGVDDRNYLRVRSQLWASYTPNATWKAFVMLNNEHRHWFKSATGLEHQEFEIDEIIFESLYVQASKIGGSPFGFTIGRQNLFWGEGFLVWDGGPLDGSRTAYFNAAVLTAAFEKRRFDAHLISDPAKDRYLPVWNCQTRSLIEWDELGAGLSYTDESWAARKLEAYYFYKRESNSFARYKANNIHTAGARWSGTAFGKLVFSSEAALQFSTGPADALDDHIGSGGYLRGSYPILAGRAPVKLSAGAIYLSGDKQGSRGWVPLYSRWPKWSELYIYTLGGEKGAAYWTNLLALHAGLGVEFGKRISLDATVYALQAPERPPLFAASPFGTGKDRGTLSVVKLNWSLEKYLSGHLLWEAFSPGDYYSSGDAAHFLRWEMLFKY
jgi:hypothetical protein